MSTLVIQARVHYFNCSHQSCGAINTKQRATANIIDSFVFPRWEKSTRWWTGWMRCLSSFILSFAIFNFNPSFLVLSRFNVTIQISSLIYHIYIYICNCLYSIFKLSIFSPAIQISQYWMWKVAQSLTSNKATAEQRLEEQKGRFRSNLLEKFNVKTSSHRFISKQVN